MSIAANTIFLRVGTAVNVQAMVFGNTWRGIRLWRCVHSGPGDGRKSFYGEFLMMRRGEDVVAGVRTPETCRKLKEQQPNLMLNWKGPQNFGIAFQRHAGLRVHNSGRKTFHVARRAMANAPGVAAVRIACEMVKEKLIDWKTAITRVQRTNWTRSLPIFDRARNRSAQMNRLWLPAGPGAATGKIISRRPRVAEAQRGERFCSFRVETFAGRFARHDRAEGI